LALFFPAGGWPEPIRFKKLDFFLLLNGGNVFFFPIVYAGALSFEFSSIQSSIDGRGVF